MKNTILIIEDSQPIADNITEILSLANYKVVTARNGIEGLQKIKDSKPSLILCDIMMPELDGYGVLRSVANNPEIVNIPFVFITAKSEKEDLRKCMDLGADDYLTKPFTGEVLLSTVASRLKKAELLKTSFSSEEKIESLLNEDRSVINIYQLSEKISAKKLKRRSLLFNEGEAAKNIYYLVSGLIKTLKTNEQGKEYITQIFKAGDFFGHSSLHEGSSHETSAIALEDAEVAVISKTDFYPILLYSNELLSRFMRSISQELSEANERLLKLAYDSSRKKVAEAILYLAKKYSAELKDNISFSICRDDLSAISALSPESVSRNLTDFKAEKLIELQLGKITILNLKKLQQLKN